MESRLLDRINEKLKKMPPESQGMVLSFISEMEMKSDAIENDAGLESLWREIDEVVASVPEDAWDELPADGAANHDHYLYGAPKRY